MSIRPKQSASTSKLRRILDWIRGSGMVNEAAERYLANASDLADLERRLRALERDGVYVIPVTFNH